MLLDLAGRRARKVLDDFEPLWHLVGGEVLAAEGAQRLDIDGLAGAGKDIGAAGLAPFLVRHADDGAFQYAGEAVDDDLDLGRIDVLAARDVHVLDAIDDVVVTVGIAARDIAGFQPAIVGKGRSGRSLVVPVAGRNAGAANLQFAGL